MIITNPEQSRTASFILSANVVLGWVELVISWSRHTFDSKVCQRTYGHGHHFRMVREVLHSVNDYLDTTVLMNLLAIKT